MVFLFTLLLTASMIPLERTQQCFLALDIVMLFSPLETLRTLKIVSADIQLFYDLEIIQVSHFQYGKLILFCLI